MRMILVSFFLSLLILGCSKEEKVDFRIYDLDIYSIPLDEESTQQEVYASVKVEGFKTIKDNGNYKFHILLDADLITPDNRTIRSIAKLDSIGIQSEKFGKYLNLEVNFVLDQSYPLGKYKLIMRGKDLLNNTTFEVSQDFSLD